jgi:hypothetical protein
MDGVLHARTARARDYVGRAAGGALHRDRHRGDDVVQRRPQAAQALGILDRLVVRTLDIEGVDRDPALGADPGESDVEPEIKYGLGEAVEEPDLVPGLDLDDRPLHRNLVVDVDGRRERAVERLAAVRVEVARRGDLLRLGEDLRVQVGA